MEKGASMSEEHKIIIEPHRVIRRRRLNTSELTKEEIEKFVDTVSRAYKTDKPKQEDLQAIRKMLIDYPEMSAAVFSMVDSTQQLIIKNFVGQPAAEIAIEEHLVTLREGMGYQNSPVMEQLLIENIVTCWLRVQHCESNIAFMMGRDRSIAVLEFWERRLTSCQRRYLMACETLAKVRKLKLPAVQVNIGDKQVNVAGNLQAPKPNPQVINQ
jgi:hypothetical protein